MGNKVFNLSTNLRGETLIQVFKTLNTTTTTTTTTMMKMRINMNSQFYLKPQQLIRKGY